jgi:hypothetical protein
MFFAHKFYQRRAGVSPAHFPLTRFFADGFSCRLDRRDACPALFQGNKKAPTHDEKGRQNGCASLLIFPKLMMLELELAPGIENKFNRLPWCHRASPSTTRHESVKSTDADKLISNQ